MAFALPSTLARVALPRAAARGFAGYVNSVTELIGETPMVKLQRVVPAGGATVLLKLEMQNPGGSIKDRIALSMIEEAEKRGDLKPGMTIVEATSGNTGIGLSMVAAAKGYKSIIVMPQVPAMAERYMTCKKFGAEVHLTGVDQEDMAGTFAWLIEYSKDLVAKHDDYWAPDQFWTEDNPKVHYATTGPEIWDQSGGCDAFGADVFAVEPTESRATVGGEAGLHGVVGIGAGFVVPMIEDLAPEQPPQPGPRGHIDDFLHASTPESVAMANRLAAEEGLLVGPTSGAVAKVCCDLAATLGAGKTVVGIVASSGIRYVKHPMWEAQRRGRDAPVPPNIDGPLDLRWRSEQWVMPPK
ncbi:hypothetical protein JL720_15389 [Aureococcus anophagefferens]|nr:hypothetical protein JL720_15389 [Aureococcus anophagefferens]